MAFDQDAYGCHLLYHKCFYLGIIYYIIAAAARIILNDILPMYVWLSSIIIAAAAGIVLNDR